MLREINKTLREIWRLSVPGGGVYRPDLHYMRGPGPKWQAKYGNLYPKASSAVPAAGTALRDLAGRRA
jgi:hypothetical protein